MPTYNRTELNHKLTLQTNEIASVKAAMSAPFKSSDPKLKARLNKAEKSKRQLEYIMSRLGSNDTVTIPQSVIDTQN